MYFIIQNPIWVVNTRLTVKDGEKDATAKPVAKPVVFKSNSTASSSTAASPKLGFIQVVLKIFKEEGIAGFWKGIFPALILVSNPIIQYTVFEKLKEKFQNWKQTALGPLDFFVLGAISKLAATSITYPYIVVKSRMQLKVSSS